MVEQPGPQRLFKPAPYLRLDACQGYERASPQVPVCVRVRAQDQLDQPLVGVNRHTACALRRDGRKVLHKIRRQVTKDYLIHPLLSGPSFLPTLGANAVANLVRNLWTHSVIMCGHFPEGVETFAKSSIEGETRGEWYLRQMIGSANISGSKAMHLMTGNLSHQIEHHLYPDLPSNRYAEIAPKIRDLMERYELRYVSGPLHQQVASAWKQVITLSLPNGAFDSARNDPAGVARQAFHAAAHSGAKAASQLARWVTTARTASQTTQQTRESSR